MVLLPGMDGKLTICTLCPEAEETPLIISIHYTGETIGEKVTTILSGIAQFRYE